MPTRLNGWRAVDAVLRTGGLAPAAEDLGVTPAAVAAQIRGLEAGIGRTLFERMRQGLRPLPEALAAAPRISAAFEMLATVEADLMPSAPRNGVSLAVSQLIAEIWLPRHMAGLFETLPGVNLRLDAAWAPVDLARADVDFAIRFCAPVSGDLESADLLPSGVVPVCTPEFATRHGLTPARRDLHGVPLAHIDVPTSDPTWADWPGWCERTGIALPSDGEATFRLTGSGLRVALSGAGLVLGGLAEVFDAVRSGALVQPLGPAAVCPAEYWHRLLWHRNRRRGQVHNRFRQWISDCAAQDRAAIADLFGV